MSSLRRTDERAVTERIAVTDVVSKRSLANGHVLVARILCGQGKSTYRSIWL
jgi:hypothetical protein